MTKWIFKTLVLTAAIGLVGCGQDVGFEMTAANLDRGVSSLSNSCDSSMMQKVNLSDVKIVGKKVASKGQRLNFQISKANECTTDPDVMWKTVAADKSTHYDTKFQPTFHKAGSYVISAEVSDNESDFKTLTYKTVVLSTGEIALVAPQVAQVNTPVTFSLALPDGVTAEYVTWNFGQGPELVNHVNDMQYSFTEVGTHLIEVTFDPLSETPKLLTHSITIVESLPGADCIADLSISGPSEVVVGKELNLSAFIPDCLISEISSLSWDFGDGSDTNGNQSVTHIYQEVGQYQVKLDVFLSYSPNEAWVTLTRDITVTEDNGTQIEDPDDDGIRYCRAPGMGREFFSEIYTEEEDCGTNGKKIMSYRDEVYEECMIEGDTLQWTEISRDKHLLDEGACEGQSCTLPDGSLLANGESRVMYQTNLPEDSCSTVSETRTCENGTLQGSTNFQHLTCTDGCPGFGSDGSTRTNVETGTVTVPLQCSYGEQGFTSIYKELSNQRCVSGTVVTTETMQGDLVSSDQCPSYTWTPQDEWSTCTADCGGTQTRTYTCLNNKGEASPVERCEGAMPEESRLCDANPEAVRRQDVSRKSEEDATGSCPVNQIGKIVSRRDAITTKTYACISHQVQLESEVVTYTDWETESYCRNVTAYRCNHDSLGNSAARGRLEWIDKCRSQFPVLQEYWDNFHNISGPSGMREYYPTFLVPSNYEYDLVWKAPTKGSAKCKMPDDAYVAAVCVSSCATPEQQILASDGSNFSYQAFIEALTEGTPYAATLEKDASIDSNTVKMTAVDQWVTELLDTEHKIVEFTMASGRSLRLTENHPILTEDGTMKLAEFFKVGENLVEVGGKLDEIVSIKKSKYFGKVYNLFVKSDNPQENIVVTNGYLNGTAYFQNEGADFANRVILRANLTNGAFDE